MRKERNVDYNKVCMIYCKPHTNNQIIEVVQTKDRFTKLNKQFDDKSLKLLAVLDKEMMLNLLKEF